MSEKVLNNYSRFVDAVTSVPSKEKDPYLARINELYDAGLNVARFNMACDGLSSESGELMEIKKKVMYQGKPWNEENKFHCQRELGDVIWYWINACMALDIDPYAIIEENVRKLESRYPGGSFDVYHSENRQEGDL